MTPQPEPSRAASPRPRQVSGRMVVMGMLLAGLLATATIFLYWELHTRPFRGLTEAIGRTFKNSLPKVEGGRHKKDPTTLRIAMRVPFAPDSDDQQAQETLQTVRRLVREHQDLAHYERVQIYLFQMLPETAAKSKLYEFTPEDILSEP